jgi:phospholipase/lecithinase/hemolysin
MSRSNHHGHCSPHHSKSTLVVFGDSLSDNGNLFALTGGVAPDARYWDGRFSNGPTYAEQLASALGATLADYAYGGAKASDGSPGGNGFPTNLDDQVASYLSTLGGKGVPAGATFVINIGSNDYLNFFESGQLPTPQAVCGLIAGVTGAIAEAIAQLTAAGAGKIVLFTLPDFSITPAIQSLAIPEASAFAQQLAVLNNQALTGLASSFSNVEIVDVFSLSQVVAADPHAFGFISDPIPLLVLQQLGITDVAVNEVPFFDGIHPTYAAHGVQAAFVDAWLNADSVRLLDGGTTSIATGNVDSFVFAKAFDASAAALAVDYDITGGKGDSIIYAGSGNVTVHGGSGDEIIMAGSGNAVLSGGKGDDVLATNSLGVNSLDGGKGDDILIANRGGTNALDGAQGDDLIVLKQSLGLLAGGSFDFGIQSIDGGAGRDTLRFIVNDQNALALQAYQAEFAAVAAAFDASGAGRHGGSFAIDGLFVTGIERIELQVDSLADGSSYIIDHDIVAATGRGSRPDHDVLAHLATAEQWGMLTV